MMTTSTTTTTSYGSWSVHCFWSCCCIGTPPPYIHPSVLKSSVEANIIIAIHKSATPRHTTAHRLASVQDDAAGEDQGRRRRWRFGWQQFLLFLCSDFSHYSHSCAAALPLPGWLTVKAIHWLPLGWLSSCFCVYACVLSEREVLNFLTGCSRRWWTKDWSSLIPSCLT